MRSATLTAGVPASNNNVYRRVRFSAFDQVAVIDLAARDGGRGTTTVICRDIEMPRAREHAKADRVACPADFPPAAGLSPDRDIATAQAVVEYLKKENVTTVKAGRSLPLLYADLCKAAGITVECDPMLGVLERRAKQPWEVDALREAQRITEGAIELACRLIGRASVRSDSVLMHDGAPLTSERVNMLIDLWLLERGFTSPGNIVAQPPHSFDCHHAGTGELRTGVLTIVDIFPRSKATLFNGDCTRSVVHGKVPAPVAAMHKAVVEAKAASIAATRAGVTGEAVHLAGMKVLEKHGFTRALAPDNAPVDFCSMQHGTGHGIGLDLKEPPLIEMGAPALVPGDAVTIEPGLYHKTHGGIRIEDMVIVRENGCDNLNTLPEGLTWE